VVRVNPLWREEAACAGMYMLFDMDKQYYESNAEARAWENGRPFLDHGKGITTAMRRAEEVCRTICNSCTVRAECLADALENGDEYTFRGGMADRERRKLMTKLGIVPRSSRPTVIVRNGKVYDSWGDDNDREDTWSDRSWGSDSWEYDD